MLGKERLCKVHKVRNELVVGVCPKRGELKRITGLLDFPLAVFLLLYSADAGGVGIILGMRTVANDENLYIFVKPAVCPKTVSLITVNLIERFFQRDATAFQFDMYQRKTVDKHRYIIAVFKIAAVFFILIDDLQTVVMDVFLVNQGDIFTAAVISAQNLNAIFLNQTRLLYNTIVVIGKILAEEPFPLIIRKSVIVQLFELCTQIVHQLVAIMDLQIGVALLGKLLDKGSFQRGLTLIGVRPFLLRFVFCYHGCLVGRGDDVKTRHLIIPPKSG